MAAKLWAIPETTLSAKNAGSVGKTTIPTMDKLVSKLLKTKERFRPSKSPT